MTLKSTLNQLTQQLIKLIFLGLVFLSFFSLTTNAQNKPVESLAQPVSLAVPEACKSSLAKKEVKIWDLIDLNGSLSKFLPIIPVECGMTNGRMQPLGIKVIPDIIIRVVGLLFVLAFYLLPGAIVLLGFNLALKPFDPSVNKTQFTEITTLPRLITKQIAGIFIGLALILFAYTIVFTILRLIGLEGEYTNLERFFE
jgi:hypothetical protein